MTETATGGPSKSRLRVILAASIGSAREDLMSWGWRLPFLASFLLILVGIFVRLQRRPKRLSLSMPWSRAAKSSAILRWKRCADTRATFIVVLGRGWPKTDLATFFPCSA